MELLFNGEVQLKAKALKTWLKSLPSLREHGNPPRTTISAALLSVGSAVLKIPGIGYVFQQIGSLGPATLRKIIANPILGDDLLTRVGTKLQKPSVTSAAEFIARQKQKTSQDNAGLQLPTNEQQRPKGLQIPSKL